TRRLERFTRLLGVASLAIVGALVAVQLAAGAGVRETFLVAVALAVSIIPEGLPVAVTVALSVATRRMAKRNVIIRHLPAVEGLGSCTVVATDKTGTLTVNQLTARRVWLPDHGTVELGGEGYSLSGDVRFEGQDVSPHVQRDLDRLALAAALCNDASLDPDLGPAGRTGDTVDLAFLVLAAKAGLDYDRVRTQARRVGEVPFAAERRYAATLTHHEDIHWLHVKGAVEVLAPLCPGLGLGLEQSDIIATAEAMAASGYRVLAVAGKRIEPHRVAEIGGAAHHIEAELSGLTFYGLVGFIDPLRPEARDAVASCRRAGVAVKMITGDHAVTALAIARDLGIASGPDDVMTGRELAGDGKALSARIAAATVFARVEPLQKVQIVEGLKAAGHVVAMTGDGVNDVPALLRADLGVAMGRDGTDAAREAADLVLTDDNFASVVSGIEEGRAAYSNIRKVVYLLLSTGAAEVVLFALALATGLPVPLMPTQLLWLNLVTNGGQDVALAFEKRNPDLLNRPPRPPGESILDRLMIRQIAISGLYTGALAYAVFAWALAAGFGEFEARNLILFLMVAFENVHVFNCRSETRSAFSIPLANNWPVVVAVIGAQLVHIAAAFIPGLRDVLQIAPISPALWALLAGIALSVLAVMEADKWLRGRQ
ncbi:MAG: cation-translocating P-type ATPase, partial [Alsobacter sp.]